MLEEFFSFTLPREQREEIGSGILSFVMPVLFFSALFSALLTLLLTPDQLFRAIPSLLSLIFLYPVWHYRHKGEPLKSAAIVIWMILPVMTFGILRSGGVYAPIFAGGVIPVLTLVFIFHGTRWALGGAIYLFGLSGIVMVLQQLGMYDLPERESASFLFGIHSVWLLLGGAVIVVPMKILYRLLKQSEEQKKEIVAMQHRLAQSQKMEALGQLAGGVAHDFNNLLTGIVGYTEIIQMETSDEKVKEHIKAIATSIYSASELTGQLLTFSRGDDVEMTPIYIHAVIKDTATILKRTLPPNITLTVTCNAEHSRVNGSFGQIQHSIINLCVNASHAITGSGDIKIATDIELHETATEQLRAGEYLRIRVSDTGCGIEEEHLQHIFDPFFTTKEKGKGTGLGLSSVYGVVIRHGGTISVESTLNKGTAFTILLPLIEKAVDEDYVQVSHYVAEGIEGATCMVVDDDPIVRTVIRQILESQEYTVLLAKDGLEALELFEQFRDVIELIMLDLMMPHMSGLECYKALLEKECKASVIIMSGITTTPDVQGFKDLGITELLRKPFAKETLLSTVKKHLEQLPQFRKGA